MRKLITPLHPDATPGRPAWTLIENEGALFRGPSRSLPKEVWNPGVGWTAYLGADRYRGVEWGTAIDPLAVSDLMRELEESRRRMRRATQQHSNRSA